MGMSGIWYRIGSLYSSNIASVGSHSAGFEKRSVTFRNVSKNGLIREIKIIFYPELYRKYDFDFEVYLKPSKLFANDLYKKYIDFFAIDLNLNSPIESEFFNIRCGHAIIQLSSRNSLSFAKLIQFFEFLGDEYKTKEFSDEILFEFRQLEHLIKNKTNFLDCHAQHRISDRETKYLGGESNQLLTLLNDFSMMIAKKQFDEKFDMLELLDVFPSLEKAVSDSIIDEMTGGESTCSDIQVADDMNPVDYCNAIVQKFDRLLTSAEEINVFDSTGYTPLHYAIFLTTEEVEKLLCYGANPLYLVPHQGIHYFTAYELALQQAKKGYNVEIFHILQASMMQIERSLQKNNKMLRVSDIDIKSKHQCVGTTFFFPKKEDIYTELKQSIHQTEEEKGHLLTMFAKAFEGDKNDYKEYMEEFIEDLTEDRTYVELFYVKTCANKEFIGFNVFSIIEINNQLILNCAYSFISDDYRGLGIMPLLAFRPAFALQAIFPDKRIAIFFNAIHYNSYRTIENLLHWPKYQSPHLKGLVELILQKVFKDNLDNLFYVHNLLSCYVKDKIKVKGKYYIKDKNNIMQKHFYERLLKFINNVPEYARAAPVLFYVGDDSFYKMGSLLSQMGVDFYAHIKHFSDQFMVFIKNSARKAPVENKQKFFIKKSSSLFFKNMSEPVDLVPLIKSNNQRKDWVFINSSL